MKHPGCSCTQTTIISERYRLRSRIRRYYCSICEGSFVTSEIVVTDETTAGRLAGFFQVVSRMSTPQIDAMTNMIKKLWNIK